MTKKAPTYGIMTDKPTNTDNKAEYFNPKDTNIIALELSISNKIGLNVDIQNNKRNKGKISFEYKDLDQLNKIVDIIKSNY